MVVEVETVEISGPHGGRVNGGLAVVKGGGGGCGGRREGGGGDGATGGGGLVRGGVVGEHGRSVVAEEETVEI